MRVAFASNYLNHHQLPFCLAMADGLGAGNFTFVATKPFNEKRLAAGYSDLNDSHEWIVRPYESPEAEACAEKIIAEADCAILIPELTNYSKIRAECGGITFLFTERILKRGDWWRFAPPKAIRTYLRYNRFRNLPFYALCSGAYASRDLAVSGFPIQKCFDWAYFIDVPAPPSACFHDKKPSLLWVGRMLEWKHPSDLIKAAEFLAAEGLAFDLAFVGEGDELPKLEKLLGGSRGLAGKVHLLGSLPNEDVRALMASADIFVATSDRREGWGAVVGEAMASSCAVIASDAMSAAATLIEDGKNGFLYKSGSIEDLAEKLALLIVDTERRRALQTQAYDTMKGTWNASEAARRLIVLYESLLDQKGTPFSEGPCSAARLVSRI